MSDTLFGQLSFFPSRIRAEGKERRKTAG